METGNYTGTDYRHTVINYNIYRQRVYINIILYSSEIRMLSILVATG